MKNILLVAAFVIFGFQATVAAAESETQLAIPELEQKITVLQAKVRRLEHDQISTEDKVSQLQASIRKNALTVILFAFFCAWWAKTTGRSAFGWFLLGLFFHVFTAIALLIKTERRR